LIRFLFYLTVATLVYNLYKVMRTQNRRETLSNPRAETGPKRRFDPAQIVDAEFQVIEEEEKKEKEG
jgi:hypothetical protein